MPILKKPHKLIPAEEKEMTERSTASSTGTVENVEEEKFDEKFWQEVQMYQLLMALI